MLSRHYELASNAGERTPGLLVTFKFSSIKLLDFYNARVQIQFFLFVPALWILRKVKQVYTR